MRAPETLPVAFPSHQPRDLTGQLELSLSQAVWSGATRPVRVSRVLSVMFERISGQAVTAERVRHLASSAREWLLQRAALKMWQDSGWFQAQCDVCGTQFDLPVTLADAPRKSAEAAFPVIEVSTSLGVRQFEAPNGGHEEKLSSAVPDDAPARALVGLCGLAETAKADAERFSAEDLSAIEVAFEAVCPDVADQIDTRCPKCAAAISARIDPLGFAFPRPQALLRDVHQIARAYHWREEDILTLPSHRRTAYADLIRTDRQSGAHR